MIPDEYKIASGWLKGTCSNSKEVLSFSEALRNSSSKQLEWKSIIIQKLLII